MKGWTLMGPVQFHYNHGDEKLGTRLNWSLETLAQMNPGLQTQNVSHIPTNLMLWSKDFFFCYLLIVLLAPIFFFFPWANLEAMCMDSPNPILSSLWFPLKTAPGTSVLVTLLNAQKWPDIKVYAHTSHFCTKIY